MTRDGATTFRDFVSGQWQPAMRYARRLEANPAEAEDLAQEAFARLWTKWGRVDPGNLEAYVRRTITNLFFSRQRRTHRWQRFVRRERWDGDSADPTSRVVEQAGLQKALAQLTPRQRTAVVLRFIEDLPVSEVAQTMGCSEASVKAHTRRGLAMLRTELDGDGADRPTEHGREGTP